MAQSRYQFALIALLCLSQTPNTCAFTPSSNLGFSSKALPRHNIVSTKASLSSQQRYKVTQLYSGESPTADGKKLDELLSESKLRQSIQYLRNNPTTPIDKSRILSIFQSIETRTKEAEENFGGQVPNPNGSAGAGAGGEWGEYPPVSPARAEMTAMYQTLKDLNHLKLFGAAGLDNYPAQGSKTVTQPVLEQITQLTMSSLTPKPTNTLLVAGVIFAVLEGVVSLVTGIDYNVFIIGTIIFALLDSLIVNGALFETAQRLLLPKYSKKILRHEAGHFLIAYLLGCPVEGCVLTTWEALQDSRFGGSRTGVSAGTSFFDEQLSEQVNGQKPLSRSTIDRYTAIVMGGIAAEAIHFGGADGGASDEMALIRFLTQISPRGGGAMAWTAEGIRNQARWGAMQAVLLLRHYNASYEALVQALERGADLGECIWAIENAAKEHGTEILEFPLGVIVDRGLFAEWIDDRAKVKEIVGDSIVKNLNSKAIQSTSMNQVVNGSTREKQVEEEKMTIEDSQEFLKSYRETMEQKLKDIDSKLESLNETE